MLLDDKMNGGFVHGKHESAWITISVDEYESMKATIETLSSPDAMKKIMQGEKELAEGMGKTLEQIKKELGIYCSVILITEQ